MVIPCHEHLWNKPESCSLNLSMVKTWIDNEQSSGHGENFIYVVNPIVYIWQLNMFNSTINHFSHQPRECRPSHNWKHVHEEWQDMLTMKRFEHKICKNIFFKLNYYQLCSSSRRLVPLFVWDRFNTRACWNVATYKWKVHNGKIEIISFVVKFRSQPTLNVDFEVHFRSTWVHSPVFNGVRVTRSLALYVCFVDRCLSLYTFSFDHCALLRYTDSDCLP
jgi:hypothetical protein